MLINGNNRKHPPRQKPFKMIEILLISLIGLSVFVYYIGNIILWLICKLIQWLFPSKSPRPLDLFTGQRPLMSKKAIEYFFGNEKKD